MIYALTSDCSHECDELIKRFPFKCKLNRLESSVEIELILKQIREKQEEKN